MSRKMTMRKENSMLYNDYRWWGNSEPLSHMIQAESFLFEFLQEQEGKLFPPKHRTIHTLMRVINQWSQFLFLAGALFFSF